MEKNKIAVVIPVYNEKSTIVQILKQIKKFATPIVVNDFSSDGTTHLLRKNGFKFLYNSKNMGYKYSLIKGIKFAYLNKFKIIISFDADNQHKISDLKKIIKLLRKYDLVYTSRNSFGRISEYFFCFLAKKIYKINDPLSGLKGYRNKVIKNFNFGSNLNLFGAEILIYSLNKNFKIKCIDIKIQSRLDKPRIGNTITSNLKIFVSCFFLIFSYFKSQN